MVFKFEFSTYSHSHIVKEWINIIFEGSLSLSLTHTHTRMRVHTHTQGCFRKYEIYSNILEFYDFQFGS